MKADFTRNTFDAAKHYSSVRMQQGRVQLDADWNEQLDIAGHRAGTTATDVIGAAGAPQHEPAFGVVTDPATLPLHQQKRAAELGLTPLAPGNFLLTPGRFYAGGTLCEAEDFFTLTAQPDLPGTTAIAEAGFHLVYLDVWQRHLTALDDDSIREQALGGPDTATRTRTVWQIKIHKTDQVKCLGADDDWNEIVPASTGRLTARAKPSEAAEQPCILPPSAGYRRLENQLYRVEVHQPGALGKATFKWSRDNGSIVTLLSEAIAGKEVQVESLGRDAVLCFQNGDWVELTDDALELAGQPGEWAQIDLVDPNTRTVTFKTAPAFAYVAARHPKMRRWDGADGERKIETGPAASDGFLELESGVQVKFSAGYYNTGDYWLIPARSATNTIEWPTASVGGEPLAQAPAGIQHTYCCLAVVTATKDSESVKLTEVHDCRPLFPPLTELADDEEARRRHNRMLHGWGVVCGLQVHCAGEDRGHVQIEPGYALQCDGSEVMLPAPGATFGVVEAARAAGLLNGSTGKICLTVANDPQRRPVFSVRADADAKHQSALGKILQGTLLLDVYRDCLAPLIEVGRRQFFDNDPKDTRLVNATARRRTAALNLLVGLLNQSHGGHVFLSADEHKLLEQIAGDWRAALRDPVFCGILDGMSEFPAYPFKDAGIHTAFGNSPMTRVVVSPTGRFAYGFGAATEARIGVFNLADGELTAEIALPAVAGLASLTVRDVAFCDKNRQLLVAATSGMNSVLFRFVFAKEGANYELATEPVVVSERFIARLAPSPNDAAAMLALLFGEGLATFDPLKFSAEEIRPVFAFNATGCWAFGEGAQADMLFATAGPDKGGRSLVYSQVYAVQTRGREARGDAIPLPATGTDGLAVMSVAGGVGRTEGKGGLQLYVVADPKAGTTGKHLLCLRWNPRVVISDLPINEVNATTSGQFETLADLPLGTDGPVRLAPSPDRQSLLVSLAELYQLRWLDPIGNAWSAESVLPVQIFPMDLATVTASGRIRSKREVAKEPLVVVANRDSHTLSVIPGALITTPSAITVPAVRAYRGTLFAYFRDLGLRLAQRVKDCLCEHVLMDCPPDCTADDVVPLACVDIRGGRVYHICHAERREVLTLPKLKYWLSAIPVLPALSWLTGEFCCLVLPGLFKTTNLPAGNLLETNAVGPMREKVSLANWNLLQATITNRVQQYTKFLWAATKTEAPSRFPKFDYQQKELVLNEDVEAAKRRLADQGVIVSEVVDYGTAMQSARWQDASNLRFTFKEGDRVKLLVKDGKVAMVTAAEATAAPQSADPAELSKEIERLNLKLAGMQESHATYLAARESEISDVRTKLDAMQTVLRARTPAPS